MNLLERLLHKCRRKSPWIFHLNTGSCNGCDIELVTCLSPRYDVEQIGIHLEGSPRHADIICITGPVTRNTLEAVKTVYSQVAGSPVIEGPLSKHIPVDVYVPGCPPHPDAIIAGIARAAQILADRGVPEKKKGELQK